MYGAARPMYHKASELFKDLLVEKYKERGREFNSPADYENLKLESAFDVTDEIKELKQLYIEMCETLAETEKNEEQADKLKKEKELQE